MTGDVARVSVFVRVPVEDAFDVFTREIDLWWRTGPAYRIAGRRRGQLVFEPGLGGRLFETFESRSRNKPEGHTIEVGKVIAWEPPRRLALTWRGVNFKPHESTRVEVSFEPSGEGTMVTVVHSGWSSLPAEHPARHGQVGAELVGRIGMWWGGLLTSFRQHVRSR
ncbi:MAG TPA: SRPBCC domain-containing protein [Kofleriaceae bacterium]|nr:SRPBCC domain-containing protein [Kofleriaceae bacterium]